MTNLEEENTNSSKNENLQNKKVSKFIIKNSNVFNHTTVLREYKKKLSKYIMCSLFVKLFVLMCINY